MGTIKLTLAGILLVLFSCKKNQNGYEAMVEEAASSGKNYSNVAFASENDKVCQMSLDIGIVDTLQFNGKVYGFCSQSCKQQFTNNPHKYVSEGLLK